MKKEGSIYRLFYKIAFIAGVVVAVLLHGTYLYDDIENLYLLPLCYSVSMLMVKDYYYHNRIGIAVAIIEATKFARYIILPIVYVVSGQLAGHFGVDLRYDYHEKAVILMCYEMLAVSLVMYLYYKNRYKKNPNTLINEEINFQPSQPVYFFAVIWLLLVLFIGSFREQLLNFSVNTKVSTAQVEDSSNNLLNIVFEFGKIYIYALMLYAASKTRRRTGMILLIILASVLYISSCWNDGGQSMSRWGLIVSSILALYAIYSFYPSKKRKILAGGSIALLGLIVLSTAVKMMKVWDVGAMNVNETAASIFASDMFDAYFQGVYGVSNGLSTVDTYGKFIGFNNFLTELFYHFPFAVRLLGLNGAWAEYYYKIGVDDKSLICPSLIQSDFYFGPIGSPLFSCFSVFLALWLTDKMKKDSDFTSRLLYVYAIFWLSLFNCINFTVVEAHIWFAIIGIWICKLGKERYKKRQYKIELLKTDKYYHG